VTAARRLGPTLLLNALRPKRMVLQPDTAPPLVTSTKPGAGVHKVRAGEEDAMLFAGADVSSVSIVRRAASRGASNRRPR
jgi:hypothetical protein